MTILGDALLEVTDAHRVNYGILGNEDPSLHAHVKHRYLTEPEEFRIHPPWNYSKSQRNAVNFDYERDKELMNQLAAAVQRHM
jgi:hypothetical protein